MGIVLITVSRPKVNLVLFNVRIFRLPLKTEKTGLLMLRTFSLLLKFQLKVDVCGLEVLHFVAPSSAMAVLSDLNVSLLSARQGGTSVAVSGRSMVPFLSASTP